MKAKIDSLLSAMLQQLNQMPTPAVVIKSEKQSLNVPGGSPSPSAEQKASGSSPRSTTPSPMLPKGQLVAAKTKKDDSIVWILAIVIQFNADTNKYEVKDAETDIESPDYQRIYNFSPQNIVALPRKESVKNAVRLTVGTHVLALYPDTSCFYRAQVLQVYTATPDGPYNFDAYVVQFEDDNDKRRYIPLHRVVALPAAHI